MKLTLPLCKQHLLRMARRHWYIQGNKKIQPTTAERNVREKGLEIVDGVDSYVRPPRPIVNFDLRTVSEEALPLDQNHPEYKSEPCYIFNDTNVLLGGVEQAQVLTNTLVVDEDVGSDRQTGLPDKLHEELRQRILLTCVFDAEQKKLPKRKDPLRPAWNFPRDYGITETRKNDLLCRHITRICEQFFKTGNLSIAEKVPFSYYLNAFGKPIQYDISADVLLCSAIPLSPMTPSPMSSTLPDLHPLHCTVSLKRHHFYQAQHHYPIASSTKSKHCHTAIIHFNKTQVQNEFDVEVSEDQACSRLLMKVFTIAASQKQALKEEGPIKVQAVQTDGQNFRFGVFQLNTLEVEKTENRNFVWISPSYALYSRCSYANARPVLEGYNPQVLEKFATFFSTV